MMSSSVLLFSCTFAHRANPFFGLPGRVVMVFCIEQRTAVEAGFRALARGGRGNGP